MEVLNRFENGERAVDIGVALGLTPTTVRTIRTNTDKIKASAGSGSFMSATKTSRARSSVIEKMEKMLAMWIEDQNQRNTPVSLMVIQHKAKSLFVDLKAAEGEGSKNETFTASRGWFQRFKQRYNFHNTKTAGEVASSDTVAAEIFPSEFRNIIEEGSYSAKQVFNVDETGLSWKRMPKRTYISKEEKGAPGFKAAKDRSTLLLGSNGAGDFKLKPMLIACAANPRALKGYSKDHLSVISKASHTVEVTNKDLQLLTEQSAAEDAGDEEEPQRTLTTKRMAEAFRKIQQGMQIFSDDDPNRERSSKIVRNMEETLRCYNEIYKEKKKRSTKQSTLDSFLCRCEAEAASSQQPASEEERTVAEEEPQS
ncbi:tigger transposable element-derived protein 1-like [Homarus americanus]|uniref:tigger transposable element-derived protein 1-like n=1 Tax=Homarus americanus TaxID=6706 RepID=UPI001C46B834|nr:tigger transposable element-derived protein 1-like [Homarus americanus]XP_042210166.1 tigger transposable element-derived protein 1-like [Homarus americanus]XP_042210167.1 tigger transposable element-derived protein 1-like [Homarus americanus]